VSHSKLRTWRRKNGELIEELYVPTDAEIMAEALHFVRDFPEYRGARLLAGALFDKGWRVTQKQVRETIRQIDLQRQVVPRNRFRGPTHARYPYPKHEPGFCWHADCNMKLAVQCGIIIYVVIDGYTRECTTLEAVTRRHTRVLLDALVNSAGFQAKGFPKQMRVDAGFENIAPCRFLNYFGTEIEPVRSVDNVRAERYWVDVKLRCLSFYLTLFARFNAELRFTSTNQFQVWLVQYLFIDR
jgi:hypothetical protein